jgi:hypothetical protein
MKAMMLVILGLLLAGSVLLPSITEAGGSLTQNDTLVRDAD